LRLKKIDRLSIDFVFECLGELRDNVTYSYEEFYEYIVKYILDKEKFNFIFVAYEDDKPIGIITCHRFLIPRYLGFGYEIEELVVHRKYQNKGYAKRILNLFFKLLKKQNNYDSLRKVIVKTDDEAIAGKLYKKIFNRTDMTVYSKIVNFL